jgi:hypothetical protein
MVVAVRSWPCSISELRDVRSASGSSVPASRCVRRSVARPTSSSRRPLRSRTTSSARDRDRARRASTSAGGSNATPAASARSASLPSSPPIVVAARVRSDVISARARATWSASSASHSAGIRSATANSPERTSSSSAAVSSRAAAIPSSTRSARSGAAAAPAVSRWRSRAGWRKRPGQLPRYAVRFVMPAPGPTARGARAG